MNRFVIAEPELCIGCNTCMAACSTVHKAVGLQARPRLTVTRTTNVTAPVVCRNCDDAPCARVCPVTAITHEPDRIAINETVCIGCKLCMIACPFGAISPGGTPTSGVVSASPLYQSPVPLYDAAGVSDSPATLGALLVWETGVRRVAVKCDLCVSQEQGPECVQVCPTHALRIVDNRVFDQDIRVRREQSLASYGQVPLYVPQEQK